MKNLRRVFIFFGIPGSGKSYLGRKFAEKQKLIFYEADDDYSEEMRELSKESEYKKREVNQNFYKLVKEKIKNYLEKDSVVIASAMGSNIDRQIFLDEFRDRVVFVKIEANRDARIENILKRELKDQPKRDLHELKDLLTLHLDKKIKSFEEPNFSYVQFMNNYRPEALNQLESMLISYIN